MRNSHTSAKETVAIFLSQLKHGTQGINATSIPVPTATDYNESPAAAISIQATEGEIRVFPSTMNPISYHSIHMDGKVDEGEYPVPRDLEKHWGCEMFWEAVEGARGIGDVRKQIEVKRWAESTRVMEVLDAVQHLGGTEYHEVVLTDVHDFNSPLDVGGQCS